MRSLIVSTIAAMGDYDTVEAANGFEALRILPREKVRCGFCRVKRST
jgi:two-component system chemotaxis response regulator CheY